jgi:fructokinase
MIKRPITVGLGEVLWDVFPEGSKFGGAPANFAAHCASLGADSLMVSAVGKDVLGVRALDELVERAVNTDHVQRSKFPTGTVDVAVDDKGIATYAFASDTAWDHLAWTSSLGILAERTDVVVFGSLGQRSAISKEMIRRFVKATPSHCLRVFDANLRQCFYNQDVIESSLELANILKINEDEIDVVSPETRDVEIEERLRLIRSNYELSLVVYTMGRDGALLLSSREVSQFKPEAVKVIDTVGAGDAYTAVVAMGLCRTESLDAINRRACEVAAYVCTQEGATPRLPV